MATLERIRRRSGLLIIVIGIAMLGFILTDLLGSGNSMFRGDATVVGRVNGRTIELREFSEKMEESEAMIRQQNPQQAQFVTRKQLADGVWDEILREELMGEQYEELGIRITPSELFERVKSNPTIQEAPVFRDQVTGQFSEGRLSTYISEIQSNRDIDQQNADAFEQWINFEESIKVNALQTKYNKGVELGIYMPTAIAKEMHKRRGTQTTANFIALEYSGISDSAVKVEDTDLKAYYQEHKEEFKVEKTASIQYVNFPVAASEEDRQEIQNELRGYLKEEVVESNGRVDTLESFANAEKDSLFAVSRSDIPVAPDFYKRGSLPPGVDSTIFDMSVGSVYGPYQANNYFRVTKITDKRSLPDSARARHILISFREIENGNQNRSFQEAQVLADSLLTIVKEDTAQFAALAREVSDDPGSGSKGGDLGWFDDKSMVRPFSNFVFRKEVGDIALVPSQFGFHIIEILDQGGSTEAVKLVSISREIMPSDATLDRIYNNASSFAASVNNLDEFGSKAEAQGYSPRPVTDLKPFDENVIGLGNNREIVNWAHNEETEVGELQLFNNGSESYVVVQLTDATEEGYRSLDAVREQIYPQVVRKKKADQLMARMRKATGGDKALQAVAGELGVQVNTQTVNFANANMPGFGSEPKVVGVMTALEPNKVSEPIEGNRGVYMVQVQSRTPAPDLPDYSNEKKTQAQTTRSRVAGQVLESLKKTAKIEDNRAKFY